MRFRCIKHLNEHHQKLNVSANQIRDEIGQHRSLIHEKLQFLHDQKKIYDEYFDIEIQRLIAQRTKVEEMFKILFTENFSSSSRKFQKIVEKFKEIQQDEKNRSFDYRPDVFDC